MQYSENRLHQSLPILIVEELPVKKRETANAGKRKPENEALIYMTSAFYGKIVVLLGVALPITDSIFLERDIHSFKYFYIYLYIGSIIFLFYMYIVKLKEKSVRKTLDEFRKSIDSGDEAELSNNIEEPVRYGSFYFRMGVTGFGIGSVIYSGFQIGQYFELSSEAHCSNIVKAVKPVLRVIFALMQMLFILSTTNFVHVQKTKIIARFGLMHMIATNLCEWFLVLMEGTQHDIFESTANYTHTQQNSRFLNSNSYHLIQHAYMENKKCLQSNIMEPILKNSEAYLAPCTVEYSLLCAGILGLMWKNALKIEYGEGNKNSMKSSEKQQSGCNRIYSRKQSQFSVDCSQAHKGLFSGILVISLTIMSLILFFELVPFEQYRDIALLQVNIWEAILFWAGSLAALSCLVSLRNVGYRNMRRNLELEHLVILVTQCGVFMYFLFQIIGAALMGLNKGKGGIMRIVTPVSALVQSCCQTILMLDAWRRRCSSDSDLSRKPGRQLVTFLLLTNFALWVVNRIKNSRSVSHPNQMDFYGILAWNIITHVTMPLAVSYRFQSTICFYEIWKHVYKIPSSRRISV